jgi:hypothetical protein
MKPAVQDQVVQREGSLAESYHLLFREHVSPLWVVEDSDYSLEQPAPVKFVPSVTTYGISEEPISR